MELEALKIFLAAANAGGFSQAAAQLYISHSTVSRNIAALERELGVPLIERSRHAFCLTPAGKRLQVGAEKLLLEAEALSCAVRAEGQQEP